MMYSVNVVFGSCEVWLCQCCGCFAANLCDVTLAIIR